MPAGFFDRSKRAKRRSKKSSERKRSGFRRVKMPARARQPRAAIHYSGNSICDADGHYWSKHFSPSTHCPAIQAEPCNSGIGRHVIASVCALATWRGDILVATASLIR